MDGAIEGWLAFIASTNFSGVEWTSSGVRKISVEPHQAVTSREQRFFFLNSALSSLICNDRSYFVLPFLKFLPLIFFTYDWSKAAFIGLILERKDLTRSR